MRVLIVATVVASLFATNSLAADIAIPANIPLAPGKAAGVAKAQGEDDNSLWWILGGAAAIGIIVLAASGGSSTPAAAAATSTVTTTTTTST